MSKKEIRDHIKMALEKATSKAVSNLNKNKKKFDEKRQLEIKNWAQILELLTVIKEELKDNKNIKITLPKLKDLVVKEEYIPPQSPEKEITYREALEVELGKLKLEIFFHDALECYAVHRDPDDFSFITDEAFNLEDNFWKETPREVIELIISEVGGFLGCGAYQKLKISKKLGP